MIFPGSSDERATSVSACEAEGLKWPPGASRHHRRLHHHILKDAARSLPLTMAASFRRPLPPNKGSARLYDTSVFSAGYLGDSYEAVCFM